MRPAVALPDRIVVLTCLGCGAMGRQEKCAGNCTEHRLELVAAGDYDELAAVEAAADRRAASYEPVVRAYAGADARADLAALREAARAVRRGEGGAADVVQEPATVVGWWCSRCGNVDLPQPCIGVCVWEPAEWVNVAAYREARARVDVAARRARALERFVARAAVVGSRAGQERRNLEALRDQARVVLAGAGDLSARSTTSDASATSASRTNPSP